MHNRNVAYEWRLHRWPSQYNGAMQDQIETMLRLPQFDGKAAQLQMAPQPRATRRASRRPGQPRVGAVLALLYVADERVGPEILLTRRPETLKDHSGQISFPGGRQEAGETLTQTALRETEEEVGIRPKTITLLGQLTQLYIPVTDFEVHPFVGWHDGLPTFNRNADEVAELISTPISHLLDDAYRKVKSAEFNNTPYTVPYFDVHGHTVWGATAMMLNELIVRWQTATTHTPQ